MSDTKTLPLRRLGRTDMKITPVGFGAWALGGGEWAAGWGNQDDADSIAAIRHAVERHGVNWIDTAAVYGLGRSEEVVGEALRQMAPDQRPFVFTKCGLIWNEEDRRAFPARIGRPESIRKEAEASLRRLGVERIDLYQMHWPAQDGSPIADYWGALLDLKAEGKVRAIGLSNHNAEQLAEAEALGHVDTLQPPFSAIERGVAESILPWCGAHETAVIVYSPMQAGLLTGAFSEARAAALGADDWRSRSDNFKGDGLRRNLTFTEALRPIAERHGVAMAAVAVAWVLSWAPVTGAIVGARNPAQVDGWVDGGLIQLSDADLDAIDAALKATGAGRGPDPLILGVALRCDLGMPRRPMRRGSVMALRGAHRHRLLQDFHTIGSAETSRMRVVVADRLHHIAMRFDQVTA
jgi:aryl-alcohol dehydrogenase-like predicted oxidoreductase